MEPKSISKMIPIAAFALLGVGMSQAAFAAGGSNDANPLTSQTPEPWAKATSSVGTTASPYDDNTVMTNRKVIDKSLPAQSNNAAGTGGSGQAQPAGNHS